MKRLDCTGQQSLAWPPLVDSPAKAKLRALTRVYLFDSGEVEKLGGSEIIELAGLSGGYRSASRIIWFLPAL